MEARVDAAYMAIADSIYGRPAEADADVHGPGEGHESDESQLIDVTGGSDSESLLAGPVANSISRTTDQEVCFFITLTTVHVILN